MREKFTHQHEWFARAQDRRRMKSGNTCRRTAHYDTTNPPTSSPKKKREKNSSCLYLLRFLVVCKFTMVCILFSSEWLIDTCCAKGSKVAHQRTSSLLLLCSFPEFFCVWVHVVLLLSIKKNFLKAYIGFP